MSVWRPATFSIFAFTLLLLMCGGQVFGAELCGRVWSGSRPIGGAMVLASAEGVIATTDSTGNFCLEDLANPLQKVQVLALGFGPAERWIHIEAETEPVRIELVPLRSISVSGRPLGSMDVEPTEPLPPVQKWGMVPFLVLPEDEDSLAALPPTNSSEELSKLRDRLQERISREDSVHIAGFWKSMETQARDLMLWKCPPGNAGFACDYAHRILTYSLAAQVFVQKKPTKEGSSAASVDAAGGTDPYTDRERRSSCVAMGPAAREPACEKAGRYVPLKWQQQSRLKALK